MLFAYLGDDTNFFRNAYFDANGNDATVVQSFTPSTVVFFNPTTGVTTTISGSGFTANASLQITGGTISNIFVERSGLALGEISQIAWSAVSFDAVMDAIETSNDHGPLGALINQSTGVTIDATASLVPVTDYSSVSPWGRLTEFVTSPILNLDSQFNDRIFTGLGNDTTLFQSEGSNFAFNEYEASIGDDILDFSASSSRSFAILDYEDFVNGPITFDIDAGANTGTVTATGFVDTLIDVARIMNADGIEFEGGDQNDIFNITDTSSTWFNLRGNEGNDTFNVVLNSIGRLSYDYGSAGNPTSGIVANFVTGLISDGFGGTDTLNILSGSGRIEIQGTDLNDTFIGSNRDERFITRSGNDTVDGGGGFDLVRYDRSGVDAVDVDLAAQTATGVWNGSAFADTLISIENVRGSRAGDDTLLGDGNDNSFLGRGGNDSIDGRGGNDYIEGDEGNDTLIGGDGEDRLLGEVGNDSLDGGDGRDRLFGGDGDDVLDASGGTANTQGVGDDIRAGLGEDTIIGHAGIWAEGEGINLSYFNVAGVGGLTITSGTNGTGSVVSGDLRVNDTFTYSHDFAGSQDNDSITGSNENRWEGFTGLHGNDTLDGGGGNGTNVAVYRFEDDYGGTLGLVGNLMTGIVMDTFGTTDTLVNINVVQGSIFGDDLDATGRNAYIRFEGDAGNDTLTGGNGNDRIEGGAGNDDLRGGVGNDNLRGDEGSDNLRGEAGSDVLNGGSDNDVLNGGDGEDLLFGGSGDDLMFGGSGFDKIFGGAGTDRIFGGNDNDIANGGGDNDIINTGSGNDLVFAQNGNDLVFLQAGNDKAFGGDGNDKIFGGDGRDDINAGAGNDQVFGGAGRDVITGAAGNDILSGGGDEDRFVFAANQGADRITDFVALDLLDISAFGVTDGGASNQDWRDATTSVVTSGGGSNVTISWDGGGTLILEAVGIASLTDSDFVF